ncbi:hypothetical protein MPTK1_3g20640 [Marchantia polymorpha subsp. ruderalis]|uniref:Phospholipid/glycerol acyltransferase domain-containing protein n=2 Tax=Marchantia polymorpha TaxID=3197 RepID=A0AAF6B2Z8_MARPO|nr:hypothetical protein MARPO_0149s0030 [Marchantia polymorpha]BBN06382.1 hypothetical protein Mp_3g20640 [Marchantia polymorpha subsp. ruderalis]|eukprot:PTQ29038.1 hypothetical protein MARPO_0149s0030 [Marchantia polymorpha]
MAASLVGSSSSCCGAAFASRRTWSSKAVPVSGIASCSFSTVRLTHGSPALRVPSSHEPVQLNTSRSGGSVQANSSRNGASNAVSSISIAESELKEAVEVPAQKAAEEEENPAEELTEAPSCPLPDFSTSGTHVALLNPLGLLPESIRDANEFRRPLLLYVPGMDCSGQGIKSQLSPLFEAGYDIRCVYIPSNDRSTWQQLVDTILPLVNEEVQGVNGERRHLTILGESFGGCLALRLAQADPSLVSRLVLVNPATNFPNNNLVGSLCAQTGLLALFPESLYELAQDILLPLMVKRNRVSTAGTEDFLSPVDFVPAACAAWRLAMLNDDSGLSDDELRVVSMPTLLLTSAKDRILSSLTEGARLQRVLPNAKRVVLPESGHTALIEDSINLAEVMLANGFTHPRRSKAKHQGSSSISSPSPVAKREEAVADDVMDEMGRILEPWRILTSPYISGAENLPMPGREPRRPLLFVGNHTMFGVYDSPLLVYELYLRGFRCRGLAHPGHWITGAGAIFERYGNVKASKFAAYKLLKEGENVLLFPGGAREVCKRKGEQYKLLWKPTTDFVRMASRLNAIIVPFGALGADEAYNIMYDVDDLKASPYWSLIEAVYNRVGVDPENVYPITSLPGTNIPSLVPVPSIERIYFHFSEPIDTASYACNLDDRTQCQSLYMSVKARVEESIELLKDIRSTDPERLLPVRLAAKLGRLLPEFIPRMPSSQNGLRQLRKDFENAMKDERA